VRDGPEVSGLLERGRACFDRHEWNEREERAYRHWLEQERRRQYREWRHASKRDQRDYWRWRHSNPNWQ